MTTAVWLTSRQVHLGIVIYPRSNIFFQLCSYSTFATGRRETRDFHPSLNTFQVCIAGTRKILRFNFFPLKSVGKLQRFMPFSGGNPIPKIALGYLLTLSCQDGAEVYGPMLRDWSEFTGTSTTSLMITITATIPSTHKSLHLTPCAPYVPSVP
jgi:hypothetical protein